MGRSKQPCHESCDQNTAKDNPVSKQRNDRPRNRRKLEWIRKGNGTREGIFNLRTINGRYLEKKKDIYICFIDYEKAFERVNHEKLIEQLKLAGLDGKDARIIASLYWKQAAVVRTDQGELLRDPNKKRDKTGMCTIAVSLQSIDGAHFQSD